MTTIGEQAADIDPVCKEIPHIAGGILWFILRGGVAAAAASFIELRRKCTKYSLSEHLKEFQTRVIGLQNKH